MRKAAEYYFKHGLDIVLLKNKKPLHRWQHLLNERQTEEEFNALPWDEADQFAVVCGKKANNGLYLGVIDVDVKRLPVNVANTALSLMRRFIITQTERTPSGGFHLVFWSIAPVKTIPRYHDVCGLELLGEGKLCIMSPSKGYSKVNDNLPSEVSNLTQVFFEVLEEEGIIEKEVKFEEPDDVLKFWLKQIKTKLNVKSEGTRYISCNCPFHPPDKHPSFVLNKQKYYAIDYHDGMVYNLKTLAEKLGVNLKKVTAAALIEDEYILRARKLYESIPFFYDSLTGYFYVYNKDVGIYLKKDEDEILAFFFDLLDAELRHTITNSTCKTRLLQAFKIIGLLEKTKDPPKTWIKTKNKIIDIENGETIEPSPEYFFVNTIPWEIGKTSETPKIDKLFTSWVGEENKQMLYEICAYSLLRDYPIHRIFILYGSGRNGKGSFLRLLIKFLGKSNCVSTDIERLETSRFETSRLYQKLLAVCAETNYATIKKSASLKALCGQDLIPAEFKFKNRFEYENYSKIIIATNNLPQSLDTSDGFFSRMIIIDFPNVFDEGKDIVKDIPDWEFENLLRKCIKLLKELLERGRFSNEGTIEEKKKRYEERSTPLLTFIKEKCEFDPDGFIPSTQFYHKFLAWMQENKPRFRTPNWQHEVKPLLDNLGLETGVRKRINGIMKRCIVGLTWQSVTPVTSVTPSLLLRDMSKTIINMPSQASQVSQKIGFDDHQIRFNIKRIAKVETLKKSFRGWCDNCNLDHNHRNTITRRAVTFDNKVYLLCEDCGLRLMKMLREKDSNA